LKAGKSSTRKSSNPKAKAIVLRVALAQINTTVGDFKGNSAKIKSSLQQARKAQADLVLFPELTFTGYPAEDLLLKKDFIQRNLDALYKVAGVTKGLTAVVGYVEQTKTALFNSAALISDGRILGTCRKMLLPNYGVFDEKRYFEAGTQPFLFTYNGLKLGLTVCEDIWESDGPGKRLSAEGQVDAILNISSSPYYKGKGQAREEMIQQRAREYQTIMIYANLVGGQDELVFDGQSLIVAPDGSVITKGQAFAEELIVVDLEIIPKCREKISPAKDKLKTCRVALPGSQVKVKRALPVRRATPLGEMQEVFGALVLGTRDYIRKNGFSKVVIGLSGGVDSALTAAVAVEALGAENVVGVMMPSPYSSKGSIDDSKQLADNLNIQTFTLPIEKAMRAYDGMLKQVFSGTETGVAEENLQARIRGNLLMALSNKFGWLVLTTGNKSEVSVGYCTLYGDMAGGFAVIKDVPKTWVYPICRWLNAHEGKEVIPENILTKPPSAELRPDQKDTDSLPDYDLLDPLLERYVEGDEGIESLKGMGLSAKEIKRITRLVDNNEYKRRQASPGVKITPKAFGRDRRLPITNRYKS
jgi:NAD+ synthase (glutamine-hydrolysing)